jgi:hypothetical protein
MRAFLLVFLSLSGGIPLLLRMETETHLCAADAAGARGQRANVFTNVFGPQFRRELLLGKLNATRAAARRAHLTRNDRGYPASLREREKALCQCAPK